MNYQILHFILLQIIHFVILSYCYLEFVIMQIIPIIQNTIIIDNLIIITTIKHICIYYSWWIYPHVYMISEDIIYL